MLWIVGVAATTILGVWWAWPHELLLLERATRMTDHWREAEDFVWTSDHEITRSETHWPMNAANPSRMVRMDFRTGWTESVPVPQCPVSTHAYMLPSPDGRWALCCDGTPRRGDSVRAVELQTGRSLAWPVDGDCYHYANRWLTDSRRWLQYTTLAKGYVTIHSVDHPELNIRLPFPGANAERFRTQLVTSSDHLMTVKESIDSSDLPNQSSWTGLDIHEYQLLPAIRLLHTLHVSSPQAGKLRWASVAPDGNHIVWVCVQSYVSPLAVWLHRWIQRVPIDAERRYSLLVSRIDGADLREIGHITLAPDEDPDPLVNWLPGNRRVSFVYKETLYTVPIQ